MNIRIGFRIASVFIALLFFLTSCGLFNNKPVFADLPMPAGAKHQTTVAVQTVDDIEDVIVASPLLHVGFTNTGEKAGATESEITTIGGNSSLMSEFTWGEYLSNGKLTSAEVFDPEGNLVEARITAKLDKATLMQIFRCLTCVVDESRVMFQYFPNPTTGWPELSNVTYVEMWGTDEERGLIAVGPQAWWYDLPDAFAAYKQWGFWETSASPYDQVVAALDLARTRLETTTPTYHVYDEDGLKEVIGRQSGMTLFRNGKQWGEIRLTYNNNWGRMPNTPFIGKGALSRIEWIIGDNYRALSILSSNLNPRPSVIYVFSRTREAANYVEQNPWVPLYGKFRREEIEGVFLAVYSAGHVGALTDTVQTEDGAATVNFGEGGGVFYSVFGDPTLEEVTEAHTLIDMLGRGGIKSTGFFYATKENQGNGMLYYLAALRLILAPEEDVLRVYGSDGGVLDRVGFPSWQYVSELFPN